MTTLDNIRELLQQARTSRDISYSQIARGLKKFPEAINQYLTGGNPPSLKMMQEIGSQLNCEVYAAVNMPVNFEMIEVSIEHGQNFYNDFWYTLHSAWVLLNKAGTELLSENGLRQTVPYPDFGYFTHLCKLSCNEAYRIIEMPNGQSLSMRYYADQQPAVDKYNLLSAWPEKQNIRKKKQS